ncbi:class I adenylate-forming enzyme family protein [Ferrovibrio sp.]|uniref:class I adenylate-forming enzyme family protein n=1 Tax=Ferrovibrio sp. TaxID=1917215 RepID=UPI0035B4B47E
MTHHPQDTWPAIPPDVYRYEAHFNDRTLRCFKDRAPHTYALFEHACATHADSEALICGNIRLSYAQAAEQAARIAAHLARIGIAPGMRVALLLGNRVEFVIALLGVLRLGAIAVPLGTRLQKPELDYILNNVGAVALIHEAALAERLPEPAALPLLKHRFSVAGHTAHSQPYEALTQGILPIAPHVPNEEDTAVILYTSGTTGHPKGAMLTHLNIVHSTQHFQRCMQLTATDRSLLAVPGSHVTGLIAIIMTMWQVGGATVIVPEFKAREFAPLAGAERITHTILVPAMYNLCLMQPDFTDHDLSHWRIGGYGGAPMPQATIDALAQSLPGLELMNAYGATETCSPTTLMPARFSRSHSDSVGLPVPCGDILVMDSAGRQVAVGETGEIWISGPMVVKGYWENAEATRASFTAGFWHSGDVGSIDSDGFVRIFDRLKDMINRGGYKVFSVEVENVLMAHPDIAEAAVVGEPCPVLGERVKAIVMPRNPGLTGDEIRAFCSARLSDYKVPEKVVLLDRPLPRNANGKILKRELRSA